MADKNNDLVWHKVLSKDELPEGRVTAVTCENRTLCMSRYKGEYGALDNKCPHQGGPLGVRRQLTCPVRSDDNYLDRLSARKKGTEGLIFNPSVPFSSCGRAFLGKRLFCFDSRT